MRKGFRIRYGDLVKAWSFTEANVNLAMENYKKANIMTVKAATSTGRAYYYSAEALYARVALYAASWLGANSVDGYGKDHDRIRGKGTFAKLDRNIRESGHPALSIAMAVNKLNKGSVGRLIRYADENPAIRQIAFNFHTPFPGTESLMMDWEERNRVIDKIIAWKKRGYPVMNSVSGLKIMKKRGFPKDCWIANYILIDGRKLPNCPGSLMGACDDCGFSMAGEMYSVLRMKPDTILAGLQLRM